MEEGLSEPYGLLPLDLYECLFSDMSGLRDGGLAAAEAMNDTLSCIGLELHSRPIVGSSKVYWVLDIDHDHYLSRDLLSILDSKLRWVNAIQASLHDWLKGRETRRALVYSFWKSCLGDVWESSPEEPSETSIPSYSVVYRYPAGNVDRGGSKAYSRSSLGFRDIFIAIVLFLGAYVWIKFREVAFKGVHPRKLEDKQGRIKVVYEARLTPRMWNGGKVPKLDLGRFATPQEAHNKFLIAAFYYNRAGGLLDGWFQVPPMSEEERSLTGLELRAWVIGQAKKVYKDFKTKKAEAEAEASCCCRTRLQEFLEGCEIQATPGHDEVNVDPCQGLALSNGHNLGCQEGSALPVSQLPPNT